MDECYEITAKEALKAANNYNALDDIKNDIMRTIIADSRNGHYHIYICTECDSRYDRINRMDIIEWLTSLGYTVSVKGNDLLVSWREVK